MLAAAFCGLANAVRTCDAQKTRQRCNVPHQAWFAPQRGEECERSSTVSIQVSVHQSNYSPAVDDSIVKWSFFCLDSVLGEGNPVAETACRSWAPLEQKFMTDNTTQS